MAPPQGTQALRALVVSYSFPPVGGAGVQRVLKLTKYLPEHGIVPSVLTVSNPSVPVLDPSLERDFPAGMSVERVRTFEPGYGVKQAAWTAEAADAAAVKRGGVAKPTLKKRVVAPLVKGLSQLAKQLLVPDPQVLWQPAAQRALATRLVARKDDVVFISGPPFSQFLLALLASLSPKVSVVLDYRDEWSTYRTTYEMMGSRLAKAIGDPLEAAILRRVDAVTTATEEFRDNLLARFRFLDPSRVRAIPNGYDPDDFPTGLPSPKADKLVVTYAGTVFKLTSARGFLGAVRKLHARDPELAKLLSVRFLGRIVDTERDAFEGTEALGVERLGYVPHEEVVRKLAESHLVLCVLDEVPGVERIYPAKIFELMYLGRPTLTLSPPGALARLVETHKLGALIAPRDEEAIYAFLRERLRAFAAGETSAVASGRVGIERFHRKALAGEFAEVFRDARANAKNARR